MPGLSGEMLGLAVVAGRRCLIVDIDAVAAGVAPRPPDRPGHAVLLRALPVALAVDRAESVARAPPLPPSGAELRLGLMPDGTVVLNLERLMAKLGGKGP